jgi:hypothetical protein
MIKKAPTPLDTTKNVNQSIDIFSQLNVVQSLVTQPQK